MKNKHNYSRKAKIALAWCLAWMFIAALCCFLACYFFKRTEPNVVAAGFAWFCDIIACIVCYAYGIEARRCAQIHLSRPFIIDSTN